MPKKKYSKVGHEVSTKQPMVGEGTHRSYARETDRKRTPQVALSIATVKRRLKKPDKRTKREIARALEIAGIGEGRADLSENAPAGFGGWIS